MKIKKISLSTVGFLSLLSCSNLQFKNHPGMTQERIQATDSIAVTRVTLKNGLRFIISEDHSSPTFAYQTWFNVGSRDEEIGKTGLAHLFEHMMFKGTQAVPDGEFDRILDEAGTEGQNAYTTQDHTTYVEQLPAERLELIVKLESDRMRNLVINDQSFSTEREVVQNERRYRNENNPNGLMYQELYGIAYQRHSYRWPVIGFAEDLAKMSSKDAREFYQKHYAPNRAVIIIAGDVHKNKVIDLIDHYYGDFPRSDQTPSNREQEPEQNAPRRKTLKLNVQVEKLLMGYPIPALDHDDTPALAVLQTILSGGRSSRLEKALVDSGIATNAYAYASSSKDPSLFIFGCSLQDKMKSYLAEKVIVRELLRLAQEEVSSSELERARNAISFNFYSSLESNPDIATFLGETESQLGGVEKGLQSYRKQIAVTAPQVREVARKYFSDEKRSVIIGLKKPSPQETHHEEKKN